MICEMTGRGEGSWMYAREFLESGNVIQANPAIYVLRTTRRFLLFLFVLLLGFTVFLYTDDIISRHGQFVAKYPIPSTAFVIVIFVFLLIRSAIQERYWKRIEPRRFAAAREEYTFLATEQPWSEEVPMLLPPVIVLRRSREYFLRVAAMLLAYAILVASFFTGWLTLDKGMTLFPSNPLLVFVVTFLAFGLFSLCILFALSFSSYGQQQIIVTEGGVTVHDNHQMHTVMWKEARLFAMYNTLGAQKSGAAVTYELSSARDIVRWTWVLRKTYWVGLEPAISHDEYNWQMQALLSFVTAKTGLPLYDLREDLPKGKPKD
jgi:hypothetical protein